MPGGTEFCCLHTMVCENLSLSLPQCGKAALFRRNQLKHSTFLDSGEDLPTLTRDHAKVSLG